MKSILLGRSVMAGVGAALLALSCPAQTVTNPVPNRVVSWNLDDWSTINPTDLAGLAAATNWVDTWLNDITIGLPDNQGNTTTLDLGRGSFNTWHIQASHPGLDANGTVNREMLNGYLNSGPAGWNPWTTNTWVTLTNIPYALYDVVVYFNSDASGRHGSIDNGSTAYFFSTVGSAARSGPNALFLPTAETNSTVFPTADFAFFPAMTTANAIFTTTPKSGNDQWLGICAFQVIEASNVYVLYGPSPATQVVPLGQPAAFKVMAGGQAPAYQWRHAGTNIPNATNATYTITATTAGQDGEYDVVINNGFSSMTSAVATLTFYAPKLLQWAGNNYAWDTTTAAWTTNNGVSTLAYTETDHVLFGPLGSAQPFVSLTGTHVPASVTVSNAAYTLSGGEIGGSGALNLVNNATLILDTTDTSSGPVTIGAGSVLQVGNGGATGVLGSGALTNNGGLVYNHSDDEAYGYPVYGTGSITNIGPSGTVTFGNALQANYLVQSGGGNLLLQGDNIIAGGFLVSGGAVWARSAGALGGAPVTITGGELQLVYGFEYAGSPLTLAGGALHGGVAGSQVFQGLVALAADSQINVDSGNSLTLPNAAGFNGGAFGLIKTGGGTLILAGTNNSWSGVNISAGTLQIGNGAAAAGFGSGNVQDDGALSFNLSGNLTVTNLFAGAGAVNQIGTGTVTLTADNSAGTFVGALNVTNGTLLIDGTSGYGAVTVAGGALGGTGTIDGWVDVFPGAALAPGASVGALTLNVGLTLGGNLLVDVNKSLSPSSDRVNVAGSLSNTNNGAVLVQNLGPALAAGDRFTLFSQPLAGGELLTVSGAGAVWTNRLAVDGSIEVLSAAVPRPVINRVVMVGGTNLVMSGTNGAPGSPYYAVSSTNLAVPPSNWTIEVSGNFDGTGAWSVTNAVTPGTPQKFYLLRVP